MGFRNQGFVSVYQLEEEKKVFRVRGVVWAGKEKTKYFKNKRIRSTKNEMYDEPLTHPGTNYIILKQNSRCVKHWPSEFFHCLRRDCRAGGSIKASPR
jgi:hypothetical protein